MRRPFLLAALGALAACSSATRRGLAPAAPEPRSPLLIDAARLAPQLRDSSLLVLHVGTPADYAEGHIPGARLVTLPQLAVADTARKLSAEMPGADTLRARLAALGVGDRTRVVVYTGKDQWYQTTRVLFTLYYAGLGERAVLLDGGRAAWVAAGHQTTTTAPAPAPRTLSPLAIHDFVVTADQVRRLIGKTGVAIVDARDAEFYTGARRGGSAQAPQRAGHIPSARNIPWPQLYDAQMRLKPRDELARIFTAAGVAPKDAIVGYCHSGQQATAMLLAARALGHRVLLYDGSYQDWSAKSDLPVELKR